MNCSELEDRLFSLLRAALWRRPDELSGFGPCERRTPIDLFDDFYQLQNDRPLSPEQRALLCGMIETIWEGQE